MLSEYKNILSFSASVTTILQFFSGSLVCNKYLKNGNTGDDTSIPFVLGTLSCTLWLCYGLLIQNGPIILVNISGCMLFTSYVFVYYLYTAQKSKVKQQLLIAVFIVFFVQLYIRVENNKNSLTYNVGLIASSTTVCFLASPLSNLLHIIRVKSVESLPTPMIIMSALVSLQWFLYGIILNDIFLQVPNAIGLGLCTTQLSLHLCFSRQSIIPRSKYTTTI